MAEILIVDDDHHLRQGFQRLLDAEGYETRTAASAEEALNLMREKMPQCVVMDVRMPGMDGLEATRRIRAFDPSVPIVAVTAFAYDRDRQKALDAGASEYLSKPLNGERLRQTLRELLSEE